MKIVKKILTVVLILFVGYHIARLIFIQANSYFVLREENHGNVIELTGYCYPFQLFVKEDITIKISAQGESDSYSVSWENYNKRLHEDQVTIIWEDNDNASIYIDWNKRGIMRFPVSFTPEVEIINILLTDDVWGTEIPDR